MTADDIKPELLEDLPAPRRPDEPNELDRVSGGSDPQPPSTSRPRD